MKRTIILAIFFLQQSTGIFAQVAGVIPESPLLAKPTPVQYNWHEQERIMFIHFGMATWQNKEYDEGDFDLSRINPAKINTDEWCSVAKSWGAKEIIFVAKHAGGFCWWPTQTTEYCVRNIPWKKGKGDLVAELAASCKKAGLNLGIYIFPGDVRFGAGNAGLVSEPFKQEDYNKIFRQQLTEVLTNYGKISEVWFDGGCMIDVNDILDKYAANAVIFQGPKATIRWPGTESGKLFYPVWNSVSSAALKTGVSTQYHDNPNGDAWAPLEADIPLYTHNWFWAPENEKKRKTLEELTGIYYKSVGYGGVLLINASPDTNGRIVGGDKALYQAFGDELNRRFSKPLKTVSNIEGTVAEIQFDNPTLVNHTIVMEDYRSGHRIRRYKVEGLTGTQWKTLATGISAGHKKIDPFPDATVTALRLTVTASVATPLIRSFSAYDVEGYKFKEEPYSAEEWKQCGEWDTKSFLEGRAIVILDLSKFITEPGQYELKALCSVCVTPSGIDTAEIVFDKTFGLPEYLTHKDPTTYYINRPMQVDKGSRTVIKLYMYSYHANFQNKGIFKIRKRSFELKQE
ncbi:MAG: alpha-L-fucosidase [Bacteroidetes bacterium]|nr:alpha-L-fucosidase [Bacteroidota bacterium]